MKIEKYYFILFVCFFNAVIAKGQVAPTPVWDVSTYPDEAGYQRRIAGMMIRLAKIGFGERSKSVAKCPDTGLPVYSWALEGEAITSPYTGRKFMQGNTGYFGAKERDSIGRITAFGGDPLKYDLPPATASLLLNVNDDKAKWFLSIPGNQRQQYHFAAKNWVRFYGLLSPVMSKEWKNGFYESIAAYSEKRRPSDGARENLPMSVAHNLVGEPGHLLGGNKTDGGTENHKTMWRTSALVYAQLFPVGCKISGYSLQDAEQLTSGMLYDFLQRISYVGIGEYDSQMYYPHSIEAYLNLFDFSKKPGYKAIAQATLDFYLATYGLKVIDGTIAGAQKRGYLAAKKINEMEKMLWTWGVNNSRAVTDSMQPATIQQITSGYRPNKVLYNILNKNIPLPFEAKMNRPSYHADKAAQFQETFYCSQSYGIGSVAMNNIDNPTQQTIWSLVAKGTSGPLCFGAAQPMFLNPTGHSPYTQTLQKKSAIVVMSGQTNTQPVLLPTEEEKVKLDKAKSKLQLLAPPGKGNRKMAEFFANAPNAAATWFFIPKEITSIEETPLGIFIQANTTLLFIKPLTADYFWLRINDAELDSLPGAERLNALKQYQVLVSTGNLSGFIAEAAELKDYGTLDRFKAAIQKNSRVDLSKFQKNKQVIYQSLEGDLLEMKYEPNGLRCSGRINGIKIDYDKWANGAVYESPYVNIGKGLMQFTDGVDGYSIDLTGKEPLFKTYKMPTN